MTYIMLILVISVGNIIYNSLQDLIYNSFLEQRNISFRMLSGCMTRADDVTSQNRKYFPLDLQIL